MKTDLAADLAEAIRELLDEMEDLDDLNRAEGGDGKTYANLPSVLRARRVLQKWENQ